MITFTHPDVLTAGVRDGWADPQTDPARIDWPARQSAAQMWFEVIDGRPLNPHAPTGVRYGRNELGHWGEALAADAIVTATTTGGQRWLLMVERGDGHGWALPGGMVEPGEEPVEAAVRELIEETGLGLPEDVERYVMLPRYVPDPRASDEAWIVTTAVCADLGRHTGERQLPAVAGADDARRAAWVPAAGYAQLTAELAQRFAGQVFAAHQSLLTDVLDGPGEAVMFMETYIDDYLAYRTPQQWRQMAADYMRVFAAIEASMANPDDWANPQLSTATQVNDGELVSEVQRLTRYIEHVCQATRGGCELCHRAIYAPHQVVELPRVRWWHPRRLRDAISDFTNGLRYGGYRIAHTSCIEPDHHWPDNHRADPTAA